MSVIFMFRRKPKCQLQFELLLFRYILVCFFVTDVTSLKLIFQFENEIKALIRKKCHLFQFFGYLWY